MCESVLALSMLTLLHTIPQIMKKYNIKLRIDFNFDELQKMLIDF